MPPAVSSAGALCLLDSWLGQAFAEAAAAADRDLCRGGAELVVSHGQTVHHWVEDGRVLGTLQLGEPAWIAERTGLPVVSNLRSRDVAAGGQGAPLVSYVDVLLLAPGFSPPPSARHPTPSFLPPPSARHPTPSFLPPPSARHPTPGARTRATLNLGGIANLTVVPPEGPPLAYDAGPANALIDAAVSLVTDGTEYMDAGGARASRGLVDGGLLDQLLADPYYARAAPKSTGKERFNAEYLLAAVGDPPAVWGDDLVATVTAHAAETVAGECRRHRIAELFVSGGGTRNPALMGALAARATQVELRPSDDLGIPEGAKEAYAFAVLGFLSFHGVPATIPSCTGAAHPSLLGTITPGAVPLRLPPPGHPPARLRVIQPGPSPAEG
jgi:anhydro-N-acetylmuramic acid kinase